MIGVSFWRHPALEGNGRDSRSCGSEWVSRRWKEAESTSGIGRTAKDKESCTEQSRTNELSPGDSDTWGAIIIP